LAKTESPKQSLS